MNRSEFLDKAVDHLNADLSPKDQADFDAYLQANPTARQEVTNMEIMREILADQVQEETDKAWAVMKTRLQSESTPTGLRALWRRWRLRLSLFAAIAVAAIEALLLLNTPAYRSITIDKNVRQIQVIFDPDAPQRQVRELLDQVQAQISAGPGPSGEYTLSLPAPEVDAALSTLRTNPLVHDAYPANTNNP